MSKNTKTIPDNIKRDFLGNLAETLDVEVSANNLNLTIEEAQSIFASLKGSRASNGSSSSNIYEVLIAYVDGGSRGNPGKAGAGAYITDSNKKPVKKLKKYLGIATNNVAEYESLLMALGEARKMGCMKIQVYADSELVVKQVKGQYKVKNETLKDIYKQVMHFVEEFDYFEITHIPREQNGDADRLANIAMDDGYEGK